MSMVNELTYLINDSLSGRVALFANGAEKYTDQAIREAFFEILGDEKLTYQNLIFISLGLLVIIVFLSMAVTIIIEMFIRKGIKYCIRERERLSEKNLKVNLLTDLKKELYKNN